jgi:hypothetical protein
MGIRDGNTSDKEAEALPEQVRHVEAHHFACVVAPKRP